MQYSLNFKISKGNKYTSKKRLTRIYHLRLDSENYLTTRISFDGLFFRNEFEI